MKNSRYKSDATFQRDFLRNSTGASHAFDQSEERRAMQMIESPDTPDEDVEYEHLRFRHVMWNGQRSQTKNGKSWKMCFVDSDNVELYVPKRNVVIRKEPAPIEPGEIQVGLFVAWWVCTKDELQ